MFSIKMIQKVPFVMLMFMIGFAVNAEDYVIGEGQQFANIADVDWDNLQAGDRVFIHWREEPYREKWVMNVVGSEEQPIQVIGVNGPEGQKPVISGQDAVSVNTAILDEEALAVINIGRGDENITPQHIIIDNLEIRSAYLDYTFTDSAGQVVGYLNDAAGIRVDKAEHLTLRNCIFTDSGNGIYIRGKELRTRDILIEKNYFYGNGRVGGGGQHNSHTVGLGMVYQYNRFGKLRSGANGNNIKDRSAGLEIKYNWIEGGNRQLDLVDADDLGYIVDDPSYRETHVYGNILIERNGDGNNQFVHYGGDGGDVENYRHGTLYFYNNTIYSHRSSNTTLLRMSSSNEKARVFNNIYYGVAGGSRLALTDGGGELTYFNNWFRDGVKNCHCQPTGTYINDGNNIEGSWPGFADVANQNFYLTHMAEARDQANETETVLSSHPVNEEYQMHLSHIDRPILGTLDMGALETYDMIFFDHFEDL